MWKNRQVTVLNVSINYTTDNYKSELEISECCKMSLDNTSLLSQDSIVYNAMYYNKNVSNAVDNTESVDSLVLTVETQNI